MNKKFCRYLILCLTLGLVSCGSSKERPRLRIDTVSINTTLDANQDSAIAVDLVIVLDKDLLKTLEKMSAKDYFAASPQLRLDNPTLLQTWHWELVPGQSVKEFSPSQKERAFGAYVFANYLAPGEHRLKVAPDGIVSILLGKNDFKNLSVLSEKDMNTGETMSDPSDLESYSYAEPQNGPTSLSTHLCDDNSLDETYTTGPVEPSTQMVSHPCQTSPSNISPPCHTPLPPSAPSSRGIKSTSIIIKPLHPFKGKPPRKSKIR